MLPCENTQRRWTRKGALTRTRSSWNLISDFQLPEWWENKLLLLKPPSPWYFALRAQMKTPWDKFSTLWILIFLSIKMGLIIWDWRAAHCAKRAAKNGTNNNNNICHLLSPYFVPHTFKCLTELSNLFLNNSPMKQILWLSLCYKQRTQERVLSKST